MESLVRDVRLAIRRLGRTPGFTLVALVTLALGIGANTAIFSVIHSMLLRPLPYPEPDRLVRIWEGGESGFSTVSPPNFVDFRSLDSVFEGVAAHYDRGLTLTGDGVPERLTAATVSPALFSVLRVRPELGRGFGAEAETPGRDAQVILSHGIWQRRFGGDPDAVGRAIRLDGNAYEVIGVMPSWFDYPSGADVWVPAAFTAEELETNRGGHYLTVLARLRAGVAVERADAEVKALAERLAERYPDTNAGQTASVIPLHTDLVGDYRPALLILAGAVALVLLIACANVANLFLVRALDRERDLAVRTALGAGRWRLVRELLAESIVLATAGGALGLVTSVWGTDALVALQAQSVPRLSGVGLNGSVLAFTLSVSILTGLIFGTLPAWRISRPADLANQLKAGRGQSEGASASRLRNVFVAGEIALALLLLIGAALLLRSFAKLSAVELGLSTDRVLTYSLALPQSRYAETATVGQFVSEYVGSLASIPEVEAAAAIFPGPPFAGTSYQFSVPRIDGAPVSEQPGGDRIVQLRVVTPDYLQALRIPLLSGRFISQTDRGGSEPVAVLSESAARLLFSDADPIGHSMQVSTSLGLDRGSLGGRVIGVVGDVKEFGPAREAPPIAYFAHAQFPVATLTVLARTAGEPGAVLASARQRLRELDPQLPLYRIRTMEGLAQARVTQPRFYTLLLGIFGGLALVLAAVGTYGAIAYTVERRSREIGIRMALGARATEVLRMMVIRMARLAGTGLVLGLLGGLAATRLLRGLLFDLSPSDPVAIGAALLVLAAIAMLAGYLPARRAARVDPMSVIRAE